MDLLTQKGRGKNVKIDVVLGKTLGILGHAEFFTDCFTEKPLVRSAFVASDRLERNADRRAGRPVVSEHEEGHCAGHHPRAMACMAALLDHGRRLT